MFEKETLYKWLDTERADMTDNEKRFFSLGLIMASELASLITNEEKESLLEKHYY